MPTYERAELLVALAQFAWTFSAVLAGRRGAFAASELRRLRRLQTCIVSRLRLGMD